MNDLIIVKEGLSIDTLEDIVTKTKEYFTNSKYTEDASTVGHVLRYRKAKKGLGFNPLDWANNITITIVPTDGLAYSIHVNASIDTTGQKVFDGEKMKWDQFIENYIRSLNNRELANLDEIQKITNRQVLKFFIRVLPYAVVSGIVIALVKTGILNIFHIF